MLMLRQIIIKSLRILGGFGATAVLLLGFWSAAVGSPPLANAQARPDVCADYNNLEFGQGHPENQAWFNQLDARGYARFRMACIYAWGTAEWECLDQMIYEESGWNHLADGPNGPAGNTWGIPQAYPGHKMASHGSDWQTNPRVQVRWMLDYIRGTYGTPLRTPRPCHAGY